MKSKIIALIALFGLSIGLFSPISAFAEVDKSYVDKCSNADITSDIGWGVCEESVASVIEQIRNTLDLMASSSTVSQTGTVEAADEGGQFEAEMNGLIARIQDVVNAINKLKNQ